MANFIRQAQRFSEGFSLQPEERYWRWATFTTMSDTALLLTEKAKAQLLVQEFESRKNSILKTLATHSSMNDILLTDMQLVLQNDMLVKADMMSMAHGLEIRSPFLDFELVNFVFSLPGHYKIGHNRRKRILQDAFREMLPSELYNRPKKGFEVPLLKWFRKELKSLIVDELLSKKHIEDQGLLNYSEIEKLKRRLFSNNPGDVHARIWGLIVFLWWCRKYGVQL